MASPLIWWEPALVLAVGACLGSFANVVIHRVPRGESIVRPGSRCPQCGHSIPFFDNVPVVSFLILRGRCRFCGNRISFRYLGVELVCAGLALACEHRFGFSPSLVYFMAFSWLLVVLSFIDLETMIIPDILSIPGILVGLAGSFLVPQLSWIDSLLGIVLGGGILYVVAIFYLKVRKVDGMGGGDIKLLAMIGAFTGWKGVLFTLFAASLSGALIGGGILMVSGRSSKTRIPFGPFLSMGAVVSMLWGETILQWYWRFLVG